VSAVKGMITAFILFVNRNAPVGGGSSKKQVQTL